MVPPPQPLTSSAAYDPPGKDRVRAPGCIGGQIGSRGRRVKKPGRRHISTSGLASSAPVTFLFCFILVYVVVFRPESPPCRP